MWNPFLMPRTTVALVRSRLLTSLKSRPPRFCLCWSNKYLSQCHDAGPVPYPPAFLCKCRSRETYGRCCSRSDIQMREEWSEEMQMIQTKALFSAGCITMTIAASSTSSPGARLR
ncbi:hypothetical protein BKA93DRAFT_611454 [Sparassis latifolia]